MAGYVSGFATGAAIEAALNKANNSQSALNATQLKAVNSGIDTDKVLQISTNTEDISDLKSTIGDINSILESVL